MHLFRRSKHRFLRTACPSKMRLPNETQAQLYHSVKSGDNSYPQQPIKGPTGFPVLDRIIGAAPEKSGSDPKRPSCKMLPFQDESILAVSIGRGDVSEVKYTYTKEQLMMIKKSPLSSRRPSCLNPAYANSSGRWDPEIWVSYCKLQESIQNPNQNWYFKTNSAPKRKNVGHRRSVESACSISPIKKSEGYHHESARRNTSGRSSDSLPDKWYDYDYSRTHQDVTMERTFSSEDSAEPEWFHSGPTSKHDMIELRGFEDIIEEAEDQTAQKNADEEEKTLKEVAVSKPETGPKGRSTPTSMENPATSPKKSDSKVEKQSSDPAASNENFNFNFNEFFKNDCWSHSSVPSSPKSNKSSSYANYVYYGGNSSSSASDKSSRQLNFNYDEYYKNNAWSAPSVAMFPANQECGSRFSRWFKKHDNSLHDSTLSTSLQEEYLSNLLNISSDSSSKQQRQKLTLEQKLDYESAKLLELLHKNDDPNNNSITNSFINMVNNSSSLKRARDNMVSVQEIEARMQRAVTSPTGRQAEMPDLKKSKKEITAFKKLLDQANRSQEVSALASGPNSFLNQFQLQSMQQQSTQLHRQSFNNQALVQVQVWDFVKNFWNSAQQNSMRSVVNPYYNNNRNYPGQYLKKYSDDKRSPAKLHKDSTLYHRRVKLNEKN